MAFSRRGAGYAVTSADGNLPQTHKEETILKCDVLGEGARRVTMNKGENSAKEGSTPSICGTRPSPSSNTMTRQLHPDPASPN